MRRTPTFLAATAAAGALSAVPLSAAQSPADPAAVPSLSLAVPGAGAQTVADEVEGVVRDRFVTRAMRVARKLAAVQGRDLRDGYEDALRTFSTEDLQTRHRELRRDLRDARRKARERERGAGSVAMPAHLAAIAECESGGDPAAIGGGGTYRGLFQFSQATWNGVGGTGDPAAAPVAEQVKRAKILYARSGAGQWPVCGR